MPISPALHEVYQDCVDILPEISKLPVRSLEIDMLRTFIMTAAIAIRRGETQHAVEQLNLAIAKFKTLHLNHAIVEDR